MITAKRTWYNNGKKVIDPIAVSSADHAYHLSKQVWKANDEAYEVTLNTFDNGGFCTRVLSKEKTLFKIEYHPA